MKTKNEIKLRDGALLTYWQLSEQARSRLNDDEFDALLRVEAMTEGAPTPEPPRVVELPDAPAPTVRVMRPRVRTKYGLGSAEIGAVLSDENVWSAPSGIVVVEHDYDLKVLVARPISWAGSDARMEAVYTDAELPAVRDALHQRVLAQEANDAEQVRYERELARFDDVVGAARRDRKECCAKRDTVDRVARTFAGYLEMCRDDEVVAERFLAKAYQADDLALWREWTGRNVLPPEDPC